MPVALVGSWSSIPSAGHQVLLSTCPGTLLLPVTPLGWPKGREGSLIGASHKGFGAISLQPRAGEVSLARGSTPRGFVARCRAAKTFLKLERSPWWGSLVSGSVLGLPQPPWDKVQFGRMQCWCSSFLPHLTDAHPPFELEQGERIPPR